MLLILERDHPHRRPRPAQPEAVLVGDDGRIAAPGARAALERPGVRHVDLAGRTLIPGFNDAHVHVSWRGMLLTRLVDTRIHVAPNIPAIVDRLAARAQSQPAGSWVEGVGYNEALLARGPPPDPPRPRSGQRGAPDPGHAHLRAHRGGQQPGAAPGWHRHGHE